MWCRSKLGCRLSHVLRLDCWRVGRKPHPIEVCRDAANGLVFGLFRLDLLASCLNKYKCAQKRNSQGGKKRHLERCTNFHARLCLWPRVWTNKPMVHAFSRMQHPCIIASDQSVQRYTPQKSTKYVPAPGENNGRLFRVRCDQTGSHAAQLNVAVV